MTRETIAVMDVKLGHATWDFDPSDTESIRRMIRQIKEKKYCIVPAMAGVVDGDALLAKIMLAKTNPKKIKEVGILRESRPLTITVPQC